jgi:asparagine synthase (glutamine-hydrolysing)
MCGIGGTASRTPPDPAVLEAMAATMVKRGPDGQGTWCDDAVGLAFRRLAIIDLHDRSSQPMHLGHLHLVFNGEIYNYRELRAELLALGHRFATEGDGEVLLHAWAQWGEGALERFNGMFAFAVWDDRARRLVLAGDPFGEKPVYYARSPDGRLTFASQIAAILNDPAVDAAEHRRAVAAYLAHGVMPPTSESFFAGIERLPAAHVLRWQDGAVEVAPYWRPSHREVPADYPSAVAELRTLLMDSIRVRLRSDVPVGTSLSGGIDSSAIVMLAAQLAGDHRRHAFTARFSGFARDEWRYASTVARAARVECHHSVEPSAADLLEDLDTLVRDHEEPVGSLSIYAQWCVNREAREQGIVVLLDGQGADELFGGYGDAPGLALRSVGAVPALGELRRSQVDTAARVTRSVVRDRLAGRPRREYRRHTASPYVAPDLARDAALGERPDPAPWTRHGSRLRRALLTESFFWTLPPLLRYADRSSMAHSREVRLPFLDRRVAEFAFSLPATHLYRRGVTKAIVRDAVRDLVPAEVLERRDKVAFEPPQARWLSEAPVRDRVLEVLLDDAARSRGLYDAAAIEADARTGTWRDTAAIWRALNAELWSRALVADRPALALRGA